MSGRLVVIPSKRSASGHASISREIGLDIVSGRLVGGDRLPGDLELGARFGVSRPVLREGVKTLVAKGLLSTKSRIGTVVLEAERWNMFDADVLAWHLEAGIDAGFLHDLAEIRLAVEPRAAAEAAKRHDPADLVRMKDLLDRMRQAPIGTDAFAEADLALHLAIADACGNRFMRAIGAAVEAALRAAFLHALPRDAKRHAVVMTAHERIVAAIEAGDAEAASAAMVSVIRDAAYRYQHAAGRGSTAAGKLGIDGSDAEAPPAERTTRSAPKSARSSRGRKGGADRPERSLIGE